MFGSPTFNKLKRSSKTFPDRESIDDDEIRAPPEPKQLKTETERKIRNIIKDKIDNIFGFLKFLMFSKKRAKTIKGVSKRAV